MKPCTSLHSSSSTSLLFCGEKLLLDEESLGLIILDLLLGLYSVMSLSVNSTVSMAENCCFCFLLLSLFSLFSMISYLISLNVFVCLLSLLNAFIIAIVFLNGSLLLVLILFDFLELLHFIFFLVFWASSFVSFITVLLTITFLKWKIFPLLV